MQRKLHKVTLVIELDDGTREHFGYGFTPAINIEDRASTETAQQKEAFALQVGKNLKQDFIQYMYDIVWAE